MDASTPRLVYAFFSRVYQTALICGSIGYFITLCAFFHLPMIFGMDIDGEANVFMVLETQINSFYLFFMISPRLEYS